MENSKWTVLKAFILSEAHKDIIKMIVSENRAWMADRTGERYWIDDTWTTGEIQKLVDSIRKDYHLHNRLSYIRNSIGIVALIHSIFLN